ncbi:hypothetical protein M3936_12510 [Sutcliffiella horikoshii]|uniref:hypothetical protein n=1 Tax=Sutcliffiella horikoshii TaxID=79883 RepID=UPI00203E5BF1|nr:hypothetical protein [Sutcliffiella horikoshii]MCM3618404.1 hypothetical protein [Sutcliffiella horikoshii]
MNDFIKLNGISILYALMMFIPLELMVNVYRINRLTDWGIGIINATILMIILIEAVAGTLLFLYLIKRWLSVRKINYWSVVLWIPYFFLFVYAFAALFPITYGGDRPNPATGLIILGGLMLYPFYILFLTSFGMVTNHDNALESGG